MKDSLLNKAYKKLQRDFTEIAVQYMALQKGSLATDFSSLLRVLSAFPEAAADLKSNLLRLLADAVRDQDDNAINAMIGYKYEKRELARDTVKAFSKDIYIEYIKAINQGKTEHLASILHKLYKSKNLPAALLNLKDSLYSPLVEKERQVELDAIAENQEAILDTTTSENQETSNSYREPGLQKKLRGAIKELPPLGALRSYLSIL